MAAAGRPRRLKEADSPYQVLTEQGNLGNELLERVRGLDHKSEARKTGSGVWRSDGGREVYETQAAIDAGRHVAKELAVSSSSRRE